MRINELKGIKNSPGVNKFKELTKDTDSSGTDDRRRIGLELFGEWLTEKGFITLGNGAFGLVFTHPNLDYVIKVFKDDKAYEGFIKFCQEHPNLIHLPKFRGRLIKIDKKHMGIRMEKLKPGEYTDFQYRYMIEEFSKDSQSPEEYIKDKVRYSNDSDFGIQSRVIMKANIEWIKTQPGLLETVELIRESCRWNMDLHPGNMMFRGQMLVITDPWYY